MALFDNGQRLFRRPRCYEPLILWYQGPFPPLPLQCYPTRCKMLLQTGGKKGPQRVAMATISRLSPIFGRFHSAILVPRTCFNHGPAFTWSDKYHFKMRGIFIAGATTLCFLPLSHVLALYPHRDLPYPMPLPQFAIFISATSAYHLHTYNLIRCTFLTR